MNLDLSTLAALAITQAFTAAGVYAALRSDIREALVRSAAAEAAAARAHERLDDFHKARP